MKKKITIVDIANHLGITPSAVSKAFSDHPRISDKTKKAVRQAAEQLGYHQNTLATGLRRGRSGLIGVLVPGIHFSFFSTIIKAIEETLSEKGYSVIISQSRDQLAKEIRQLDNLMKAQVEGVIASVSLETNNSAHFQKICKRIPVVLFDRTLRDLEVSKVVVDDYMGSIKAVDHLVEKGYRRIAHIGGLSHVEPFRIRQEGYRAGMQKHGLEILEGYEQSSKLTVADGESIMNDLLKLPSPPDAIYAASDLPAYGVIKCLKERGIAVPQEVGVVGFSNEAYTEMVSPTITTLEQHSENMGLIAAKSMLEQLQHQYDDKEYVPQQSTLTPKLVIRESSNRK
ncbi:LacI family DNA-binding transcriptional regulator [Marinoscillum furvescens]|uniref:LacI family transcriptional regulator n=1 Tax=Marinoscillum furvescens DSM 4134 TaxID=1122208 RepID=A0A3D9L0W6_MARFU|nr:LacI family DNA-binding transcriptional regulator [Marinoscillum furvescens]RED94979.1 LacI family transcriptional regulator [Marinoscillum furvescens DSM 4134]